jgi:hypothetical protein
MNNKHHLSLLVHYTATFWSAFFSLFNKTTLRVFDQDILLNEINNFSLYEGPQQIKQSLTYNYGRHFL